MQDKLANAISTARSLIQKLSEPLNLGSVVKHSKGDIGIVFGIKVPNISDDPWSYCVRWVQIEGMSIETEGDGLIDDWMDADEIEEIPPQPIHRLQWPQIGGIGGEIATENYDSIDSCESWVDKVE